MSEVQNPPELNERLARYLVARRAERAIAIETAWGRLTERERHLVKEAAVMAYVRGAMHGAGSIPPDSDIVAEVVGACLGMPDLYPVMSGRDDS